MPSTNTPNMSLIVPTVGQEPGPTWAEDLNNNLLTLDSHDHGPGAGIPITPSGLSISSDLTFMGNNAIGLRSTRYTPQSSPIAGSLDLGCLSVSGVDLYYRDGNGNVIRITQSGSIAGAAGSIAGLVSPASATYVAGTATFVWQSDSNVAANMDGGSVLIRKLTVSSPAITVAAPSGLGSNYTMTLLTAPPASSAFITMDNTGNLGSAIPVANGITRSNLAAVGQQVSASCGTGYTNTTNTPTDVTNLTVTITTTGRPVMLMMIADGDLGNSASVGISRSTSGTSYNGVIYFVRSGTQISLNLVGHIDGTPAIQRSEYPPGSFSMFDVVGAGTYTYKVQASTLGGTNNSIDVNFCKLVAYEL